MTPAQLRVLDEHKSRRRHNIFSSAPHAEDAYYDWYRYWSEKAKSAHGADRGAYLQRAEANLAAHSAIKQARALFAA